LTEQSKSSQASRELSAVEKQQRRMAEIPS
jgi:hypothetical protein